MLPPKITSKSNTTKSGEAPSSSQNKTIDCFVLFTTFGKHVLTAFEHLFNSSVLKDVCIYKLSHKTDGSEKLEEEMVYELESTVISEIHFSYRYGLDSESEMFAQINLVVSKFSCREPSRSANEGNSGNYEHGYDMKTGITE